MSPRFIRMRGETCLKGKNENEKEKNKTILNPKLLLGFLPRETNDPRKF